MAFDGSDGSDGSPPQIQNNTIKSMNQFQIIHLYLFLREEHIISIDSKPQQ